VPKYVVRYRIVDIFEATVEADNFEHLKDIIHDNAGENTLEDCSWIDGGVDLDDYWILREEKEEVLNG